jgi:polyhydroxybutyrate depolymerase
MHLGRRPALAVAVAIVAGLGACSSSAKTASPPATTTPTTGAPTTVQPSVVPATTTSSTTTPTESTTATPAGCRTAAGYTPGTTTHQITVDGLQREFLVHLPPRPGANMRLVVNFHGAGSNMQQEEAYTAFDPLADANGFVVAYPNGVDAAIRQWNFLTAGDVDFARAVVQTLVRDACVDPAHAYAVGISSGGGMTASLACRASDTFAGFGPVAGDFFNERYCGQARPRPVIIFHGTADPLVPYNGGNVITRNGLPVQPAETVAAAWAGHNGCTAGPERTQLSSEVVRLTWSGCVAPVVMYRIEGGGHVWPGAPIDVARLGMTTQQISATDEMWKFFAAH